MSFVQRGQARPGQTGLRRRKKGLLKNKTPLAEGKKENTVTIGITGKRGVECGVKRRRIDP
jgi:hypothetical protein